MYRIVALLERLEEAHVEPLNLCGASEGKRKQWGHQDKMAYRLGLNYGPPPYACDSITCISLSPSKIYYSNFKISPDQRPNTQSKRNSKSRDQFDRYLCLPFPSPLCTSPLTQSLTRLFAYFR